VITCRAESRHNESTSRAIRFEHLLDVHKSLVARLGAQS